MRCYKLMTLQRKFPFPNPRRPISNFLDQLHHSPPNNLPLHHFLIFAHSFPRPPPTKESEILRRRDSQCFSFRNESALERQMGEIQLIRCVSTALIVGPGVRGVERDHEWNFFACRRE